jgi:hypothetical protein
LFVLDFRGFPRPGNAVRRYENLHTNV